MTTLLHNTADAWIALTVAAFVFIAVYTTLTSLIERCEQQRAIRWRLQTLP